MLNKKRASQFKFYFPTMVWVSGVIMLSALYTLDVLAQLAETVPVQPSTPPSFVELLPKLMPMFVLVFIVFHFMVIKPQQAKRKKHDELLGTIKKGDQIVTSGGIFGKVLSIEAEYIYLEISNNVKIKVDKFHIDRFEKAPEKPEK